MSGSSIRASDLIKGESRTVKGLTLHPLKVENYEDWLDIKPVLLLRMATLPAALAVMPYASAIFAIEVESIAAGTPVGLLNRFVLALCLALQLPPSSADDAVQFLIDPQQPTTLKSIAIFGTETVSEDVPCVTGRLKLSRKAVSDAVVVTSDGKTISCPVGEENTVKAGFLRLDEYYTVAYQALTIEPIAMLKPSEITPIRKAIAEMNGEKLPDEAENPELVDALRDMAGDASMRLDIDLHALISSVAYKSGVRERDILDWTIYEFEQRRKAIDREINYVVNGIGEMSGAKWPHGNPYPSWCFDRASGQYGGFTPISTALNKLGASEAWLDKQINEAKTQQKG